MRHFNTQYFLLSISQARHIFSEQNLCKNIQIFETFFRSNEAFFENSKPLARMRYYAAHSFFAVAIMLGMLCLISWILFLIYSIFYPHMEFVRTLLDFSNASFADLPMLLTVLHLFILMPLLLLAPAVYKFYRVCTDVVPLGYAQMPSQFFDCTVIKRMETMYKTEMCWQYLVSTSHACSITILLFSEFFQCII